MATLLITKSVAGGVRQERDSVSQTLTLAERKCWHFKSVTIWVQVLLSDSKYHRPWGPPAGYLANFKLTNGNLGVFPVRALQRPPPAAGQRARRFRLGWASMTIWVQVLLSEYQGSRLASLPTSSWQLGIWECSQSGFRSGLCRPPPASAQRLSTGIGLTDYDLTQLSQSQTVRVTGWPAGELANNHQLQAS